MALRGGGKPVYGDGRAGLPATPTALHPEYALGSVGVLTEEPPAAVDLGAYGMRVWIEQGFRVLKRRRWPWHRTRRVEEALLRDLAPGARRHAGPTLRVFQLGLLQAQRLWHRGYAWTRVWAAALQWTDLPTP